VDQEDPIRIGDGEDLPRCGKYKVRVTNLSGTTCWGYANIEDKLPPHRNDNRWTECGETLDDACPLSCFDPQPSSQVHLSLLETLYDDCSGVFVTTYKEELIEADDCELPDEFRVIYNICDSKDNCITDTVFYLIHKPVLNDDDDDDVDDSVRAPAPFEGSCEMTEEDIHPYALLSLWESGAMDDDDDMVPDRDFGIIPVPYIGIFDEDDNMVGDYIPMMFAEGSDTYEGCNLLVTFMDDVLPVCTDGGDGCDGGIDWNRARKVLRTYKFVDWCSGDNRDISQLLTLYDDEAPDEPTVSPTLASISTDPWSCMADVPVPSVSSSDLCTHDDHLTYQWYDEDMNPISGLPSRLGLGDHQFYVTATDCCGNESDAASYRVWVSDDIKPFAIAKEFTVASLIVDPNDPSEVKEAISKVRAESIDNGSYDHCSDVKLEVRRITDNNTPRLDYCDEDDDGHATFFDENNNGKFDDDEDYIYDDWGPFVKFCCYDLTNGSGEYNNQHKVELRVWDDANGDGEPGNTAFVESLGETITDNYSITWGWVKVEDPTPPELESRDITLYCHDPYDEYDSDWYKAQAAPKHHPTTGAPIYVYGTCEVETDPTVSDVYWMTGNPNVDPRPHWFDTSLPFSTFPAFDYTCGYGYGWFRLSITGSKGTSDVKYVLVTVLYKDDFSCDNVDWPQDDLSAECDPGPNGPLQWDAEACELIGWSLESDTFNFESDACLKIINDYTVIDWCVYDAYETAGSNSALHSYGYRLWAHDYDRNGNGYLENWDFNHNDFDDDDDGYVNDAEDERHGIDDGSQHDDNSYDDGDDCTEKWEPRDDEHHESGKYYWRQVIKITDDTDPEMTNCQDTMVAITNVDCYVDLYLDNSATDEGCEGTWYKWRLFVDTDRNGTYDIVRDYYGQDPNLYVRRVYHYNLNGGMVTYDAKWKVWDGCGNSSVCDITVMIVDKKPPTPYCVSLSSAVMENGQVELWARDFNIGSFDNCYPRDGDQEHDDDDDHLYYTFDEASPVKTLLPYDHYFNLAGDLMNANGTYPLVGFAKVYQFGNGSTTIRHFNSAPPAGGTLIAQYRDGDIADSYYAGDIQKWIAGDKTSGHVFVCTDLPEVDLKLSVWDQKWNTDFCVIQLSLVDNLGGCDGGARAAVSGNIATEEASDVAEVEVNLESLTNPEYQLDFTTGNDGDYAFSSNPMYSGYDISAKKDGDDTEGVTTLDLVLIQRHILGLEEFTSPYKMIAADINSDRKISSADLLELRKTILGIHTSFPSNNSWRFVDASQTLTVENALRDFSEVINIGSLEANMSSEDFIATKIGDVNATAATNARSIATNRSLNTLSLGLTERAVKTGERVELTFSASEFKEVYGYQFTLELNGLEFQSVIAGSASMTDANVGVLNDNTVTVSYSDMAGIDATDNLFTLVATAKINGNVSKMVGINSSVLTSEVYTGNSLDINTLELTLNGTEVADFNLSQNEPNPFKESTVIGFTLPEAGKATITVYDVAGKVVKQLRGVLL